ncbi:hypothetical protein M422DRAFT_252635, partial [Sphaerobolus stellatus SS14]
MSLVVTDLNQVNMSSAKVEKSKSSSPTAELKNGKVVFRQKAISFENLSETMQEIVKFREYMATNTQITAIPDDHLPLIGKLIHERYSNPLRHVDLKGIERVFSSDKTIPTLVKSLQSILCPPTLGTLSIDSAEASLPSAVLETAIKVVAERVNYGVTADIEKPPTTLCIWRWEVKNRDWLPPSVKDITAQRLEERKT